MEFLEVVNNIHAMMMMMAGMVMMIFSSGLPYDNDNDDGDFIDVCC